MKHRTILLTTLLLVAVMTMAAKKFVLVIDAGHGGNDAGAIGNITQEKRINLNVALAFGRLVENNCKDVKVIYTRKTDVFIPLHTRADIANKAKADLFISIHTNALPKGRISRGIETYTLGMHRAADNLEVAKRENEVILYEKDYKTRYQGFDPNSSESYIMFEFMQDHNMAQSVELAKSVQKRITAASGRQNKGVKQAGFLVLRETSMPSCLIELGFISTPDEEQFLHSTAGVERLSRGIYQAFIDYKVKHYGGPAPQIELPQEQPKVQAQTQPQEQPKVQAQTQPQEQPKVQPQEPSREQQMTQQRKNTMAEELENAREGRGELASIAQPTSPNADSIIAATPQQPQMQPQQPQMQPQQPQRIESQPQSVQTVTRPQQSVSQPQSQPRKADTIPASTGIIYKVQIMAADVKMKSGDPRFKGLKNVDYYTENGLYKYTVGASPSQAEISKLRKSILDRFPQAFVVAFKDGQKIKK